MHCGRVEYVSHIVTNMLSKININMWSKNSYNYTQSMQEENCSSSAIVQCKIFFIFKTIDCELYRSYID